MENSSLMKKSYSRYAFSAIMFLVAAVIVQLFNNIVLTNVLPQSFTDSSIFAFLNIIVPEYFVGFPVLIILITLVFKMDKKAPEKNKFGFGKFIVGLFMMIGAVGVGAVIGAAVNFAIVLPFGVEFGNSNALANLMSGSNAFFRILTVGILAPIVEELVFRKFLIDRVVKYGEWVAIITSGLMFGLFHGNFSQFFFATLIGGIFAYIYIRTGKVWITIVYHMILNLATSVVTTTLLGMVDYEAVAKYGEISKQVLVNPNDTALQAEMTEAMMASIPYLILCAWFIFLICLIVVGIVVWIIVLAKKKIKVQPTEAQVEKGMKYAWGNVGMIIFIIGTVALFVFNYLAMILPAIKG